MQSGIQEKVQPDRTRLIPLPASISKVGGSRYIHALVIVFYLCFFFLFSSGRMSGGDPNEQLRAAMLLAATGKLGVNAPPEGNELWVQGPNGRYYECHDIGNILLMFPSAFIGSLSRQLPVVDWIQRPPVPVKIGASLTYAVASAVGCYFMFLLFALFHRHQTAFALSLAFVTTTPFWAFSRSAWDVLGAAIAVCILLYYAAQIGVRERIGTRSVFFAGASLALACAFRYSLMPFLGLSLATVFLLRRKHLRIRDYGLAAAGFLIFMLPTFAYNYVRMGSPLRPGTVAARYMEKAHGITGETIYSTNALTGNMWDGLYGMLVSPNWGLIWFSPIFLLLVLYPFLRKRMPHAVWTMGLIWGGGAILYLLLISHLQNWQGIVGWGSRYLVPVMPILFFILSAAMAAIWARHSKWLLALLVLSFVLNVPPALVNWHQATLDYPPTAWPDQIRYRHAPAPRQQAAVWRGLFLGMRGRLLPVPPDWEKDPRLTSIAAFPDLWLARLMQHSQAGLFAGLAVTLGLGSVATLAFLQILRTQNRGRTTEPAGACSFTAAPQNQ